MGFKTHYQLLASYNQRMNQQVYAASSKLDKTAIEKDAGAYFGSVIGSLNHIMVGDLFWLTRFREHSERYKALYKLEFYPLPVSLNQILYDNLEALGKARSEIDNIVIDWISETKDSDFDEVFSYTNSKGKTFRKMFSSVVGHFFNHQTHHRGQVSTLLNQFGEDVGVTDFIVDIPQE